jgi:hypothetical protein
MTLARPGCGASLVRRSMTEIPSALSNSASATSYAVLYALWKAGADALDEVGLVCDPDFLLWTANVRLRLTCPELEFFDEPCKTSECREQRIARLRDILMVRHQELVDQKRAANGAWTLP